MDFLKKYVWELTGAAAAFLAPAALYIALLEMLVLIEWLTYYSVALKGKTPKRQNPFFMMGLMVCMVIGCIMVEWILGTQLTMEIIKHPEQKMFVALCEKLKDLPVLAYFTLVVIAVYAKKIKNNLTQLWEVDPEEALKGFIKWITNHNKK